MIYRIIIASLLFSLWPIPAYSQSLYQPGQSVLRTITDEDAMLGKVTIEVASGYGVNLSFQKLNEKIVRIWIDDVSELLIDFDRELPNTRVIHLRRLQPGDIPLQTRSITRETTMTVVTERRLYQFFLRLVDNRVKYKTVVILPTSRQLIPIGGESFATLVQVEQGIEQAIQQNRILPDSPLIPRVREFITLVRRGMELEEASASAGISLAVVSEFGRIGKDLPKGKVLERIRIGKPE